MRIKLTGKNIKITPRIRNLIADKIATNLENYLPKFNQEIKTAIINIQKHSRWGYKVNFSLWLPQKYQLFAQSQKRTLKMALTDLKQKLQKQVKKYSQTIKY